MSDSVTGAGSVSGNVIQNSTVTVGPVTAEIAPAEPERQFVTVDADHLAGFFEGRTTIQANRLLEPFLGKWMRVAGLLGDVEKVTHAPVYLVSFQRGLDQTGTAYVLMVFPEDAEDHLGVLPVGDPITVVGKISTASGSGVTLDGCELEKP